MKNNLLDICCIVILIIIIGCVFTNIYRANLEIEEENPLDQMIEDTSALQEEIEEPEEEELITQDYEINGNTYEVIAILNIPTLEIEYPILSTTSKELLKVSLNKYWGPNPNRPGNFCILGHNYNDNRFLGNLYKINIGDLIELTDMSGKTLQYHVYETYTVNPDDTSCTSQLTNGETELTLITCTRNFKQRFIVKSTAKE